MNAGKRGKRARLRALSDACGTVSVRCSGKIHKLRMDGRGHWLMLDHDYSGQKNLQILGNSGCRCYEVITTWGQIIRDGALYNLDFLPQQLRPIVRDLARRSSRRRELNENARKYENLSAVEKILRKTRLVAEAEMESLQYRRSCSSWVDVSHYIVVETAADLYFTQARQKKSLSASATTSRRWSKNGRWSANDSCHAITIAATWLYSVYNKDLSIIDDHFVLAVLSEKPLLVVAVRQGRGLGIYAQKAAVVENNGTRKLIWLKEGRV